MPCILLSCFALVNTLLSGAVLLCIAVSCAAVSLVSMSLYCLCLTVGFPVLPEQQISPVGLLSIAVPDQMPYFGA